MVGLVSLEVRELVRGSFLEQAPMIPVSSRTGAGLDQVREALLELGRHMAGRTARGAARLPVDRVFTMKGFGTVVTGTLVAGTLAVDDEVALLPHDRAVKVRGIQVHGERVAAAEAGQRAAVNLGGVDVADVRRGDVLATSGSIQATRVIDARIDVLPSARALRHGARVRFHQGTAEVMGRLAVSGLVPSPETQGPEPPGAAEVPGGRAAFVRLRLESEVVLTRGDRFILRTYSPPATIAGGVVLDPRPPRGGIRTAPGRARFAALDEEPPGTLPRRACRQVLADAGAHGVSLADLGWRVGLGVDDTTALVASLETAKDASRVAGLVVDNSAVAALVDGLLRGLEAYHRLRPLSDGLPREEARERFFARAGAGVFERVLADLVAANRVVARDVLALASHKLALNDEEAEARGKLERWYRDAFLQPPGAAEAAPALGIRPDVADRIVQLLVRQRVLVKVETLVFHQDALARLKADVAELKLRAGSQEARLDVAAFKDRYGVTRKFAIPLLEYLDRERVTRRDGDTRVVL
jgi:selenocysteine-specific elongation factor